MHVQGPIRVKPDLNRFSNAKRVKRGFTARWDPSSRCRGASCSRPCAPRSSSPTTDIHCVKHCPSCSPAGTIGQTERLPDSAGCTRCDQNKFSEPGSDRCTWCGPGYFATPNSADLQCEVCLRESTCPDNTTLTTVELSKDRWRISGLSRDIRLCIRGANGSSCTGGTDPGNDGSGYCLPGHTGPLCQVCSQPEGGNATVYFDEAIGICIDCPTIHLLLTYGLIALALLTIAAAMGYALFKFPPRQLVSTSLELQRVWLKLGELGLRAKAKLLIVYLQIALDIPDVYGIQMPEGYQRRMQVAFAWIKFDYTQALVPGQCLVGGVADRLIIRGLTPLALMLVFILANILKEMRAVLTAKPVPRSEAVADVSATQVPVVLRGMGSYVSTADLVGSGRPAHMLSAIRAGVSKALPLILFLSFSLCPAVSSGIFSVWNCEPFEDNSEQKTTQLFMHDDLSVRCTTSDQTDQIYNAITSRAFMCGLLIQMACCLHHEHSATRPVPSPAKPATSPPDMIEPLCRA